MNIENVMYFALGLLIAGLLALMIMPAVWRRAVRLTKKRIEAATPMSMAEFRADKDQLRAEFALSTRRLEMNVEALRRRLAEQLRDVNRRKTEVGAIIGERDTHLTIVRELEQREADARARILQLEKEGADVAQKLRMREREFGEKVTQLEEARAALKTRQENRPGQIEGRMLSGDYDKDIAELAGLLEIERKRAAFLDSQNRQLIGELEGSGKRSDVAVAAAAQLRQSLAEAEDQTSAAQSELVAAEAHIADAENRVSAILQETTRVVAETEIVQGTLLAEKLTLEEEMARLKTKVLTVEATIMADWDSERIEQAHLREKLNDIAADVGRLVYAIEEGATAAPDGEETLLARVQRFADDGVAVDAFPLKSALEGKSNGAVSDRIAALREIQERG
jgi:hypothetical protein